MNQNILSIIIPAYNEEKTIANILNKVTEVQLNGNLKKEIIVVNDCSKDNTVAVVEQFKLDWSFENIQLFHQSVNQTIQIQV